jgi:hypothetical protein
VNAFPLRTDGQPSFNEGFVFDGDGELKPARAVEVPWMRRRLPSGEVVPLVLETADGLVEIEGVTFINCRSRGHSVLPARFRWNGEEATGMIERSTLPAQMEQ